MLQQFEYKKYVIEYQSFGNGENVLFCFHGFGRDTEDFLFLKNSFSNKYTIYAFNLFYHGNSYIKDGYPISKKELKELFQHFFATQTITRFSLFGYSLGGKVTLCLYEIFAHQIDSVVLAAPDGIKISTWYNLVSNNKTASAIYKNYIIPNPSWFLNTVSVFRKIRIIPKGLHKFVHYQLSDKERRQLVYDVWISHKLLTPDIKKIISLLNKYHTPFYLIFGKYDAVIKPQFADYLIKNTGENVHRIIIDKGHNLLTHDLIPILKKAF